MSVSFHKAKCCRVANQVKHYYQKDRQPAQAHCWSAWKYSLINVFSINELLFEAKAIGPYPKWPWKKKNNITGQHTREGRHPFAPKNTAMSFCCVLSSGQARKTETGSGAHSRVPQTAVQCHLEVPEAAVEEHFRRNHGRHAQVSPIPAGVHLGFSISAATTCTLRPLPGERKAAHDCHCWFCSHHTTNPLLIPLGEEDDVTITGATVLTREDSAYVCVCVWWGVCVGGGGGE